MLAAVQNFIPVLTSEAGLCLTAENWQESHVKTVSYSLEFLLHKPGLALLKKITDLSRYLGWSGELVINAMSLVANKEGTYTLKSPYDGSKIKITAVELIALIQHLKPNAVILPKKIIQDCPQIWEQWDDSIQPFLHVDDLQHHNIPRSHGVYFNYSAESALEKWSSIPRYVVGAIDLELIQSLKAQGVDFIETDEPAMNAFQGKVYSTDGIIDLTDSSVLMRFETIDATCSCQTCSQKFTKAYFYHLLQHTPLLCQRLLIQHNVSFTQQR